MNMKSGVKLANSVGAELITCDLTDTIRICYITTRKVVLLEHWRRVLGCQPCSLGGPKAQFTGNKQPCDTYNTALLHGQECAPPNAQTTLTRCNPCTSPHQPSIHSVLLLNQADRYDVAVENNKQRGHTTNNVNYKVLLPHSADAH